MLGLSAINFVSILFYKYTIDSYIKNEVSLILRLKKYNKFIQLPDYIKISNSPIFDENFEFIEKFNDKYVFIRKNYKYKKLKNYAFILFLWEGVLIISLMLIIYITLLKYIKKEHFLKNYLEITLLTITHKLGNFLAIQRLNLELIKNKCNIKPIQRLEKAYKLMEKDFKFSIKILKNINKTNEKLEKVNLKDIVLKVLNYFEELTKEKDIKLSLKDIDIKANPDDIENILFTLIENAVKFSEKKIYIKMCKEKGKICILIKNDIKTNSLEKGTGIGMKVVEFLIKKYNGFLKTKTDKDFLIAICFSK